MYIDERPIEALRVTSMTPLDDGRTRLSGKHTGVTYDVTVSAAFMRKYHPHLGGYFVRNAHGSPGFKSAPEFEAKFQKN